MITVLSPGARTLVQDAGRPGYEHLGVPTSGAADLPSLRLANLLVGNAPTEPAVEVAAHGPTIEFSCAAVVAYAGADVDLFLDDRPVPTHHTLRVGAGQVLRLGALRGGLYGYLAVAGGLDVPRVLGSASSCTLSGLGPDTALAAGHQIRLTRPSQQVEDAFCLVPSSALSTRVRVLPGPHLSLFDEHAVMGFFSTGWSISALSSRVGIRLDGGSPIPVPQVSLPSMGMVRGAVQIPPNGMPIVLGPDHGTVGGYPVLGVIHPDDMAALMQRPSGDSVAFAATSDARSPAVAATRMAIVRSHTITLSA